MSDKQFTIYWLDGTRRVITGDSIEEAFTAAGYGAGAIRAVDFYMKGDDHDYEWNKEKHSWEKKDQQVFASTTNASYGIDIKTVFMEMPAVTEDEYHITQSHADKITQSIKDNPGKYKLMVSHNLGATYLCEYSTDDKDDPELHRRIVQAKEKMMRYYVDGDDGVICDQHKTIINFFSAEHQPGLDGDELNIYGDGVQFNRNPDLHREKNFDLKVVKLNQPQRSIEEQAALLRAKFGK